MDPDDPLHNLLDMQANIFSDISFSSVATRTDKENQSIITDLITVNVIMSVIVVSRQTSY